MNATRCVFNFIIMFHCFVLIIDSCEKSISETLLRLTFRVKLITVGAQMCFDKQDTCYVVKQESVDPEQSEVQE